MFRPLNIFSLISDIFLKLSLGIVFFNYGYGKLIKLINNEADSLINMVSNIPFFGLFPVFFSWSLALTESLVIFAFVYGYISILPFTNFIFPNCFIRKIYYFKRFYILIYLCVSKKICCRSTYF